MNNDAKLHNNITSVIYMSILQRYGGYVSPTTANQIRCVNDTHLSMDV